MRPNSRMSGVGGLVVLAVALAGPVAAQSPSLRAAMLHGIEPAPSFTVSLDTTLTDPWLGRDKALHAAGSFLLTLSAQYVLTAKLDTDSDTAWPIAAGTTLALGLTKEIADSQRPVRPLFSPRDLAADAVGVALAVGLILL